MPKGVGGSTLAFALTVLVMFSLLGIPGLHNGYIENLFRGIFMFGAMSLGWNMVGGFTGYVSFGNVVFFGLGCYTSAVLSNHGRTDIGTSVGLAMLVGAAFAVFFGIVLLRLRGHYFGIATLAIALATAEVIANLDQLGGATGLAVKQDAVFSQYYYAMWGVCLVSLIVTFTLTRAKFGYACVAIRENEEAAVALGIHTTTYKIGAWAIGAMMAAGAGAVFAYSNGYIDPATAFSIDNNVFPIAMALLGGLGTAAGPVIGAFVMTAINETLWAHLPRAHTLFFGIAIIFIVVFMPRGLIEFFRRGVSWKLVLENLRTYGV